MMNTLTMPGAGKKSGGGTAAFDGQNVIMGQQAIYWNGALRLVKGDGGFIGGYDANGNLTSRVVDGSEHREYIHLMLNRVKENKYANLRR